MKGFWKSVSVVGFEEWWVLFKIKKGIPLVVSSTFFFANFSFFVFLDFFQFLHKGIHLQPAPTEFEHTRRHMRLVGLGC